MFGFNCARTPLENYGTAVERIFRTFWGGKLEFYQTHKFKRICHLNLMSCLQVLMAQVKKDPKSGQSKGFGFIRFGSYEVSVKNKAKLFLKTVN